MNDVRWNPYDRNCPSRRLRDSIGNRWAVLVVGALDEVPRRFSQIQADVDAVSQKMITQTLRGPEWDGLVRRTVYAQVPPRVDLELMDAGRSLRVPLRALIDWVAQHMTVVLAAQGDYDVLPLDEHPHRGPFWKNFPMNNGSPTFTLGQHRPPVQLRHPA